MKLNETYYTRTIYGLAECDGKRISETYAVIRPWFNKDEVYYIIHINSGLRIGKEYKTIKECMSNFVKDLAECRKRLQEKGLNFEDQIETGTRMFNRLVEEKQIVKEIPETK